jgi:hypothetical protein
MKNRARDWNRPGFDSNFCGELRDYLLYQSQGGPVGKVQLAITSPHQVAG